MTSFSLLSFLAYLGGVLILLSAMFAQGELQEGTPLTPKITWATPPPKLMWEIFTYLTASLAALALVLGMFYGWWSLFSLVVFYVFELPLRRALIPSWAKAHGQPNENSALPTLAVFGPAIGSFLVVLSLFIL